MAELDFARSLAYIFQYDFLLVLFPTLYEAQINKRLKHNLTLGLVNSHWKFSDCAFITKNFYDLSLVLEFLTQVLYLGSHWQSRCNFRLHVVQNRKVGIDALIDSDSFGLVSEVPDLDSDFIQLVDFDILEDHLRWYDLEGLFGWLFFYFAWSTADRLTA